MNCMLCGKTTPNQTERFCPEHRALVASLPEPHAFIDLAITPKITKVTAEAELYVDGHCVGTTTVDLTPT